MEDIAPVTAVGMAAQTTPVAGESSSSTQFSSPIADMNWLSLLLLGLTTASLIYSIVYYRKQIQAMESEEGTLQQKITVLESNLKKVMGGSYSEKG